MTAALDCLVHRSLSTHVRIAIAALAILAALAMSCSSSSTTLPPRSPSAPATSAAATAAAPAVTIESLELTATPVTPTAPRCPDPNVTPIASAEPSPETEESDSTPTPIRIAHPLDVPPAPSATPAATPEPTLPAPRLDAGLDQLIRTRLGGDAEQYAIVIENLRDGRRVEIDPDRIFYAASLFKLEVMYEVFAQRDAGILDLGEQYVASDYYFSFGLGPRRIADCEQASIGDLLAAMMSVSDNVAAVMLQDRAGPRNINNAMAELGLEQTELTEDGSLPTTAGDMARLVATIARADTLSRDASDRMIDLMTTEEINDRIPRHLPGGTRIAHKTGNWDDATHDAGIVYGAKGTYVMVLMSDIGFDGDAGSVEADIAKIAFDYFER